MTLRASGEGVCQIEIVESCGQILASFPGSTAQFFFSPVVKRLGWEHQKRLESPKMCICSDHLVAT